MSAFGANDLSGSKFLLSVSRVTQGFCRGDSDRACAYETYDGKWEVRIVRYSALSDPLMEDIE